MWKASASIVLVTNLSACGGSGDVESGSELLSCSIPQVPNAAGTACVAPEPIQCSPPTVPDALNETCIVGADPNAPEPIVFPAENQALLFFNKADGDYEGYRLHNWNDESCQAYADDSLAESWSNGLVHTGVDPVYGAYWLLNLLEDHDDCGNFIIHIGSDDAGKEMGGGDWTMPWHRMTPTSLA